MEKRIRTLNFIFAFLMAMTVLWTYAQPAYAASADIRVVSQIAFKDVDSIDCVKYKYNKKGLAKRKENYHNDVLNSAVNYIYDSDGLLTCAVLRTGGKKT